MMNCKSVQSLLSEFADETLDAATAWQVQAHVSGCAVCGRIRREMASLKQMLHALPAQTPSAGFDAALAQRLALTRRPAAAPRSWRDRMADFLSGYFASPARRLRPALALGLILTAGGFAMFFPARSPDPAVPVAFHSADPAFVADCVAQHHRDAASEPLADLSAQTLAGSLDRSASASPAAVPDSSADSNLF